MSVKPAWPVLLVATTIVTLAVSQASAEPRRFLFRQVSERVQDAEPLPTPTPSDAMPIPPDAGVAPSWSDAGPGYAAPSYAAPSYAAPSSKVWQGAKPFQRGFIVQKSVGIVQPMYGKVIDQPHVSYVHHRAHCKSCCASSPPMSTVLSVTNPRTHCTVAVPVCIPSCCVELASVNGRCALLGRGMVNYTWCCGFSLKVVFDRHGDVTVHYYGA